MSYNFQDRIRQSKLSINRSAPEVLQLNLGKLCNQACLHCHVEAGPKRTEIMTRATAERIAGLIPGCSSLKTLDLTGGAPELNPNFRYLVEAGHRNQLEVIDRCNLSVFFEEGQEELAEFLAEHKVRIIASLPCYTAENLEKQRGKGVFKKSIQALEKLNRIGYGRSGSNLIIDLVYNPVGASLPPDQLELEAAYQTRLGEDFGIVFNNLYTITNMPIARFLQQLKSWNKYEEYMDLLVSSFNPGAAENVMCRNLISVSWDGKIFDCDFNQMLELPLGYQQRTIWDIQSLNELSSESIAFGSHCFGCCAGAGSSCTGAIQ